MYFGRQTFLCLEYWPLPHWHKSMVCNCPVFQRQWQDWHLLQTFPFQYNWTPSQLHWPGPVGYLCWRACTYGSQMQRPQPHQTLEPPFTHINLQPVCSGFSSVIKLPPYFKQYSSGFQVALKSANLHIPKFTPFSFRVWKHFDLSNITKPEVQNLRKLALAPKIPIDQLRAHIANFRHISSGTDRPWIYYVRGGSGSGLILLVAICCLLYWCCKRNQMFETRLPACVTIADPENPNMMHTRVGAIGTNSGSVPGWRLSGSRIQQVHSAQYWVMTYNLPSPWLFLTNLKNIVLMSENITEGWGIGITLQRPWLRQNPPLKSKLCKFWHFISTPYQN